MLSYPVVLKDKAFKPRAMFRFPSVFRLKASIELKINPGRRPLRLKIDST